MGEPFLEALLERASEKRYRNVVGFLWPVRTERVTPERCRSKGLDFGLLRELERVVDLDTKVAHGTLNRPVP